MVKQMVKKMKMAHKLMLLVGSVIVVALVIVLFQLKSSAQLADDGNCIAPYETYDRINNVCVDCNGITTMTYQAMPMCTAPEQSLYPEGASIGICSTACSA